MDKKAMQFYESPSVMVVMLDVEQAIMNSSIEDLGDINDDKPW